MQQQVRVWQDKEGWDTQQRLEGEVGSGKGAQAEGTAGIKAQGKKQPGPLGVREEQGCGQGNRAPGSNLEGPRTPD